MPLVGDDERTDNYRPHGFCSMGQGRRGGGNRGGTTAKKGRCKAVAFGVGRESEGQKISQG
jgi:hypothetical protein